MHCKWDCAEGVYILTILAKSAIGLEAMGDNILKLLHKIRLRYALSLSRLLRKVTTATGLKR